MVRPGIWHPSVVFGLVACFAGNFDHVRNSDITVSNCFDLCGEVEKREPKGIGSHLKYLSRFCKLIKGMVHCFQQRKHLKRLANLQKK